MDILSQYREQLRTWRDLWGEYMRTGDRKLLVSRPSLPVRTRLPCPPVIWVYRHPDTKEGDEYDWYSFLYSKMFFVGGRKFRHGTGRFVDNRSTRHGRVDWPATVAAIREWIDKDRAEQHVWEDALRDIDREEFLRVAMQLPGWDFVYGHDSQSGRVLRDPHGEFLVCTFDLLWVNSTLQSIAVLRETYRDLSLMDAQERSRADAPKRLQKLLRDSYHPWSWVSDGVDF